MDGALDLAAVHGIAVAGLQVGGAAQFGHVARLIAEHLVAAHDVGAHEPYLAAGLEPLELGRRHLGKVGPLDPQLPAEGNLAGGGVASFPVGVVGDVKILHLVGGVVGDGQLDGIGDRHPPGSGQLHLGAHAPVQQAVVHQAVVLGHARLLHKGEDAGRAVAPAAQAAEGGHAGVVPAVHDALLHQFAQVALAHDGVGHVQAGKLALDGIGPQIQVVDDPLVQGTVVLKLDAAHGVGDALQRVLDGMGKVVQGVDAPLVPLAVMAHVLDPVDGRVAQVHVGAGQVDLGAQGLFPVRKLARPHPAEQVQVLLRGAVPVGAGTAGLARVLAPVLLHLLAGQVVHVGLAVQDQLFRVLVALVKIVAAVEDAPVGHRAQPLQVLPDAVHILLVLPHRVGVVEPQVELAAVLVGNAPVDPDGLGAADVQVAVGLRREPGVYLFDPALGQVGVDDFGQKIVHSFSHVFRSSIPECPIFVRYHIPRGFSMAAAQLRRFCAHP